jgi:hypothetical protein
MGDEDMDDLLEDDNQIQLERLQSQTHYGNGFEASAGSHH